MTSEVHPDLDTLILYCMATPDAQSEAVRTHLAQCPECRAQAELLRTDLVLAALAVPQTSPPAGAKQRLFAAAGVALPGASSATSSPISPAGAEVIPLRPRRSGAIAAWTGWIAAAACLFYAVQVRDANQVMRHQLHLQQAQFAQATTSSARAEEVLAVLSSPQAQRVTLVSAHAVPEPTGHAVYLADRGALVFTASHLAPLPAHKTYELWVIPANGSAPMPAGTFTPDARGMASILLPALPKGVQAKAFGVTMENAGGSVTPTLPILLAGG